MIYFGLFSLLIAIFIFFVRLSEQNKLQNLRLASASTVASLHTIANQVAQEIGGGNLRDYVKLKGTIECDRPLISQLKQEPCVYYSMTVVREYEEQITRKDSEGKTIQETRRSSETVAQNSRSIPFILRDNTGEIVIDPDQADLETVKILEEFHPQSFSEETLSFGNFSLNLTGKGGGSRTLGYRYTEHILPLGKQIFVLGNASDEDGTLTVRKPSESEKVYIISLKTEEELTEATNSSIQWTLYGTLFFLALGLVLIVGDLLNSASVIDLNIRKPIFI